MDHPIQPVACSQASQVKKTRMTSHMNASSCARGHGHRRVSDKQRAPHSKIGTLMVAQRSNGLTEKPQK